MITGLLCYVMSGSKLINILTSWSMSAEMEKAYTGKTLSLKNLNTKYVQIMQKNCAKISKNFTKQNKILHKKKAKSF